MTTADSQKPHPDAVLAARRLSIERYWPGWIIVDYSGTRGEAAYRGKTVDWRRQPLGLDAFDSEDDAKASAMKELEAEE